MPSRSRFARSAIALCAAAVFLVALSAGVRPASAQDAAQGLKMTAALEISQIYRAGSWQPVRFQFRNETDRPIDGTAVLPLSYPGAPAAMQLPISVPPRAGASVTVWGYFPPPPEGEAAEKGAAVLPLAVAEFRGPGGAGLARSDLLGVPITFRGGAEASYGERGEMVLLVNERGDTPGDAHDVDSLIADLADATGLTLSVASVSRDALPRQAAGLRAVKAVVLEAVDPESLDAAQRAALEAYLHGGGVVVVAAPVGAVGRAGSWFERYFPVRLIGSRHARAIETSDGAEPLQLREPLPIVEAVEGGGQALLRGTDYVHVAVRPVGMGKVVFTSFPLNALAEKQPRVAVLWEQLLGVRRPLWDFSETQLGEARHQVLGSMIGRKVAPWGVAAGVAAGYVLLVLGAQALFVGPARPKAFVASVGLAVLLSGALLAMGMSRRGGSELQSARLAVVDLGPEGYGWQQESVAFVGSDKVRLAVRARDERVMIRPALADDGNPPTIRQQPFAVPDIGVYAERIERVWEASGPADPAWRIEAVGAFGSGGFSLNVNNGTGMPLRAPLVIWNGRAASMEDLPPGAAAVNALQINERGNFSAAGVLTSDEAKRRALIVRSSLRPAEGQSSQSSTAASDAPPMFVAWLPPEVRGELIVPGSEQESIARKSMVLVRTPLRIEPTATGRAVRVPAAFVRLNSGRLPYDHEKGESVATPQPGQWEVSFAVPPQVGRVRPRRITISTRVTLPAHSLSIRTRTLPAPVATWSREVGPKEVSFECAPGDVDEHGRVRLTLDVQQLGVAGAVPWQVSDLGAGIEAEVVGPPAPLVLDAPQGAAEADNREAADGEWTEEEDKQ